MGSSQSMTLKSPGSNSYLKRGKRSSCLFKIKETWCSKKIYEVLKKIITSAAGNQSPHFPDLVLAYFSYFFFQKDSKVPKIKLKTSILKKDREKHQQTQPAKNLPSY